MRRQVDPFRPPGSAIEQFRQRPTPVRELAVASPPFDVPSVSFPTEAALLSRARSAAAPRRSARPRARRRPGGAYTLVAPAAAGLRTGPKLSRSSATWNGCARFSRIAKADASEIAADRDVAAAQVALAEAERRFRAAQARRKQAALEAAQAKLEVEAQQAVIDRRAYATYVSNGASAMLTLVVDAESVGDLLDRSKMLDNVAKAATTGSGAGRRQGGGRRGRRRAIAAEQQEPPRRRRADARARRRAGGDPGRPGRRPAGP